MAYDTLNGLELQLQLTAKVTEGLTLLRIGFLEQGPADQLPMPDRQYPRHRVSLA